jgi:hypothetical protein
MMVPFHPTAHTFVDEVPQRDNRSRVVPLETLFQVEPFQRRVVPPPPEAHTLVAELPQTLAIPLLGSFDRLQAVPFQRRITPLDPMKPDCIPAAQTLVDEVPHTALRSVEVPLGTLVHAVPFQRRMVPLRPTAHTSVEELPQTARRSLVVPLATLLHAEPFHRRMVPALPTAHASLGEVLQTALSPFPCGSGFSQHQLPPEQIRQTGAVPLQVPLAWQVRVALPISRRLPWHV